MNKRIMRKIKKKYVLRLKQSRYFMNIVSFNPLRNICMSRPGYPYTYARLREISSHAPNHLICDIIRFKPGLLFVGIFHLSQ